MSSRFFGHRELHLVLLALLARQPMHGYEIMGELGERFGPQYRPSAGSVYPAIEALGSEGLICAEEGSTPTTYALTDIGRAALVRRSGDLLKIERRTGVVLGTNHEVEAALVRVAAIARVAAGIDSAHVEHLLNDISARLETLTSKETL